MKPIFIYKIKDLQFYFYGTQLVIIFLFRINYHQRILTLDMLLIKYLKK